MDYFFLLFLFIIAFLYSSVGHGGASGYLALMALCGVSPVFMRPAALLLNIFVSAIAFYSFYKAGYFRYKLILPFIISSIPMAFAGGLLQTNPSVYKIILGIFLLIAIARLFFKQNAITEATRKPELWTSLLIGAILGFFSGMIGIGGGIILSPLLLLMHYANLKEAAAASALFIFLNSLAGIIALFNVDLNIHPNLIIWLIVGILGGFAGSVSGSFKLSPGLLKYFLATVLFTASLKLFFA